MTEDWDNIDYWIETLGVVIVKYKLQFKGDRVWR